MASFTFNIAKGRTVELYNRVESNDPANSLLRAGAGGLLTARFRPVTAGTAATILRGSLARWHTY